MMRAAGGKGTGGMKKILIVEDDTLLRNELKNLLEGEGYEAEVLTDFECAEEAIRRARADLILLDINLPFLSGETLLRRIRKESGTPVIMVTSRTSEVDEAVSMSSGADDYVTKPYSPAILLLRIAAIFRRMGNGAAGRRYRQFEVCPSKGTLVSDDEELALTKNEMIIFERLLEKQGCIVTRDELMTALWDNEEYVNDNALTVNISRLRGKLADAGLPEAIETKKKRGYLLK